MVHTSFTIVGLGNPGKEYEKTRHNAGRLALEHFKKKNGFPEWEYHKKENALMSEGEAGGVSASLLLPETMMNNSGNSVMALKTNDYRLTTNLVVVHDDLDLPLGSLKIAYNRGSAGHKGVESIIAALGTKEFTRVRLGVSPLRDSEKIKKPEGDDLPAPELRQAGAVNKFVLKKFSPAEWEKMEKVIDEASAALFTILTEGREKAMNVFN